MLHGDEELSDEQKASLQSVPAIIWAQIVLNGYDCCGVQPLFTMLNRFGKEISCSSYDPWEPPAKDDDVEFCDRQNELFEEMNQRKRAREDRLAGLTYEGEPDRTSSFTGSRCLGGYVSYDVGTKCSACHKESKFFSLFRTSREWEKEYDERAKCWRFWKRRCAECELKERLEEDVDRFWKAYDIQWEGAGDGFARPDKLKYGDLCEVDLKNFEAKKIVLDLNGRMKTLTRAYFTEHAVGRDIKHQGKSQGWFKNGQDCARAVKEVRECVAMKRMVMVNKAEVQRMGVCSEVGVGQFKVQSKDGEPQVLVHPSMKVEMRPATQLTPLHTIDDMNEWNWDDDKKAKDLALYQAKFQEKEDDYWLDRRQCVRCSCTGRLSFKSREEEETHRKSPGHLRMIERIPENEFYCPLCEERFEGQKAKELLMKHLLTGRHQEQVSQMKLKIQKIGDEKDVVCTQWHLANRYIRAKYSVQARVMITGMIKSVLSVDKKKSLLTQLVLAQIRSQKGQMEVIAKYVDALNNDELLDEESPERANLQLWEKVSGEIIAEFQYTVGEEQGLKPGCALQLELLHALDYNDRLFDDAYLFNVCSECGMTIPSKMWWERQEGSWQRREKLQAVFPGSVFGKGEGKWSYKCLVEWHKLECELCHEEEQGTKDGPVKKVYQEMQELWDENVLDWPVVGCGRGFRAYSDGPSMVLSVLTKKDGGEESWEAMMAERLPQNLDDAVKRTRHISLDTLCNNMDPDKIYRMMPMSFPVSPDNEVMVTPPGDWNQAAGPPKKVCGVVQYPVKQWKECGAHYLSGTSWCKLMMVLGSNNPEMAEIVEIAESYEGRHHDSHSLNMKNLKKQQEERVRNGWTSTIKEEIAKGDLKCWKQCLQTK